MSYNRIVKKLWLIFVLALLPAQRAAASIDTELSELWATLSDSGNFHLFDNGSIGYYHDFMHDLNLMGLQSTLYEPAKYHTSLDANVAGYQQGDVSKGFVFPSVTFHAGELTGIQKLESIFSNPLSVQLNIGGWVGRDWNAGVWRGGVNSNLSYFWGS